MGLKPTYGAVSRFGMIAFASSLDQAGPLTRDVTDAALIFRHMVGHDDRDATSVAFPEEVVLPTAQRLDGIRLGVPDDLTGEGVEPGVMERFEATLAIARDLGASVERVSLPHADYGLSAYYVLAPAEASSNLARYDGVRYGLRREADDLLTMYTKTRHDGFGAEVKRRVLIGTYALSSGYYDAYYGRAQRVRTLIAEDFKKAFERVDFVVTPTSPGVAFELGAKTGDPLGHVPQRLLHRADAAGGDPRDLDPVRPERGAARGLSALEPGLQRESPPRRRPRARAGDRLRQLPGPGAG